MSERAQKLVCVVVIGFFVFAIVGIIVSPGCGKSKESEESVSAKMAKLEKSDAEKTASAPVAPPPVPAPKPWQADIDSVKADVQTVKNDLKSESEMRSAETKGLQEAGKRQAEYISRLAEANGRANDKLEAYIRQVDNIATEAHWQTHDALEEIATTEKRLDALTSDLTDTKKDVSGLLEAKKALEKSLNDETVARARVSDKLEKLEEAKRQEQISANSPYIRTARLAETRRISAEEIAKKAEKALEEKEAERRQLEERVRELGSQPTCTEPCRRGLFGRR